MYFAAPDPNAGCSNPSSKIAWDETEIFGSKITAITWNTGKINFNYSTIARTDLTTDDNRLQSIVVLDNATPANQKLKFNFIHSYFGRSSTPSNAICIPDGPTGRLRLDKIQQEGINGGLLAPYEFQYYGNILPSYMSYSQDHWGFNNGRSNTTLVPASKLIYNGNTVTLTGGNRSPDLEACESGTLSKITYPTGGSSQFIYELHSAYMQSFGFQPEPDVPYIKLAGVAKENFDRIPENDVIFEIDGDEVVGGISGITVRILTVVSGSCNPTIRDGGCGGEAYLIPVQGTQADTWLFSNVGSVNGSKLETKFLPNGHYKLVLGGYGSSSELKILAVVISVPDPNYIAPDGMINNPIGGLRIAKIINSDGFGLDNTKSYFYNREGEPSKSSGVLVSSPVYGYTVIKQQYHSSPLVGLFNTCYFYTRSANSKVSLGLTQGSHIGYSFVEEIKGSAENPKLGKTTYKYTSAGEYPDRQYSSFPFPPATSYDMKRGLLKEQKDYSFYGAGFQISREIINNYTLSDSRYRRFQKGVVVGSQGTSSDGTPSDVLFNEFSDESLWVWLQQTKTRLYASNQSGSYNETTLNYFYDNAVYPQLSRTETYNSKQELTKTELKYPYDLAASPGSTSNTYNEMVNRHILDKIVEQVKTNGTLNKELTKTKTHFSGFNSNLILPSVVENSFAGKNLQTEASFISYDSKGNVLQVNPRSTGPVSYVWGYDNTLPVAKVFNTAVTNIFYTSFEGAEGNSAEGDSRTGRKSITGGYVRFINNIANGNYILSYWKKNGSNWELQSSTISVTNGSATINIIGQIDELRFYPAKAQMMTYAYDPLTGIINECDVNNRINTYDYDEFGRLKLIKDQDNNIIKTFDYKYQQPIN